MSKKIVYAVGDTEFYYDKDLNKSWIWCWGILFLRFDEELKPLDFYLENKIFPEVDETRYNKTDIVQGGRVETLVNYLLSLEEKTVIYFHNLKADASFIVDYALKNEIMVETLIDDMGLWYTVKIGKAELRDSLKIWNMSLKALAKSFKLSTLKGDMNYNLKRLPNHILTESEQAYFDKDVLILAYIMDFTIRIGLTKLTSASCSANHLIKRLKEKPYIGTPTDFEKREFFYNRDLKTLTLLDNFRLLEHQEVFCRRAYKGGICQVNLDYIGKIIDELMTCGDIVSMYPHKMDKMLLPYGCPDYFKDEIPSNCELAILRIHLKLDGLKPNRISFLQLRGNCRFMNTEFVEKTDLIEEVYLTNIEYDLLFETFEIGYIKIIDGYAFKGAYGMFHEFINDCMFLKESVGKKNPAVKMVGKLLANSSYGKYAQRKESLISKTTIDGNGVIRVVSETDENGETIIEEIKRPLPYIPVAVFITAYSRVQLTKAINDVYGKSRFLYCDTDSIYVLGKWEDEKLETLYKKSEIVNGDFTQDLGKWEIEIPEGCKALFQNPKRYIVCYRVRKNGQTYTRVKRRCAGLPNQYTKKINFKNFKKGSVFPKKVSKFVNGGLAIVDTEFTIK